MRSLTKILAAVAVALPLIGAAGTAQARDYVTFGVTVVPQEARWGNDRYDNGNRHRALAPGVVRGFMRQYYREVSRPERRGDVYVARAEDNRGRDLNLTADAYSGRIIDVQYARRDDDRRDDRSDRREDRRDGRWNDRNDDRRDNDDSYYR